MATRRGFLGGLAAAGVAPRAGWSSAGRPAFLSAGQDASGQNALYGLSESGDILFRQTIPARGHAAAAHPRHAQVVGFARRPGDFAFVLDCETGAQIAQLTTPEGRHFYGHGVFSPDGATLFTTENDYDAAVGMIGVWDARDYSRLGEFPSGGVGPHDVRLVPGGLVVANGGIETHPDMGRAKLNLPVMEPNLSYLSMTGDVLEQVDLPALRLNSIRHLDVRADGLVAVAMQWQGGKTTRPPVLALHTRGRGLRLLDYAPEQMNGYGGSVVFSRDGSLVAVSSPRGGRVQVFDVASGALTQSAEIEDVCGLGASGAGFVASAGTGRMVFLDGQMVTPLRQTATRWDNHLVRL